jgi:outer membrane protein TolC
MAFQECAPVGGCAVLTLVARTALASLLGLGWTGPAAAQTVLSLDQAQRIAVEQSTLPAAQELAASAARDMALAAGRLPDPVLRIGIDNLPVNGAEQFRLGADSMTMRRVGVMQELTRAEKRSLRAERFERDADLALAEKAMAVAAIERETAIAWLDLYYAEAMVGVIAQQGEQAGLEVLAAQGAFRAGTGSQADVYAARSAVATLEDRKSELGRRVHTARTMLARWIGAAADGRLAGLPPTDRIGLDPAALESRLATLPQIAVLGKQEDIAATEARLAQANKKPDWSVEVMYQQRGPSYPNMVSVGVSVPLQWDHRNRQDRELSSKRALLGKAKAEREDALRQQVAQTRSLIGEWENGRERLERYTRELIPLAGQRTAVMVAAYGARKAALTDVLGARRDEIDVRLRALELEAGVARLWAQLRFLFPSHPAASRPTVPMTGVAR